MNVARSELTGEPLTDRAIGCLFYYRSVFYKVEAIKAAERRLADLRRSGATSQEIAWAVRCLERTRRGPSSYAAGLILRGPNPPPRSDAAFLQRWNDAQRVVRYRLADRVAAHLSDAEAGNVVYGLRWTPIGQRWRGFVHSEERWASVGSTNRPDEARPGRYWRHSEGGDLRFSPYDEPPLPGRYGALHAVPVGRRGEPTLEAAKRVDAHPAVPLALVHMSLDELRSLRTRLSLVDPLEETVAAYLVEGTGSEWEAPKKALGRLKKRANEIEFRHLGDIGRLTGRQRLPDHVLAELRPNSGLGPLA